MKILIFSFSLAVSLANAQTKNEDQHRPVQLVRKIIVTFSTIRRFDNLFQETYSERIGDSINKYNRVLLFLLSSADFGLLTDGQVKKISQMTEIKVSRSLDKKVAVFSWLSFVNVPSPTCSSVVWFVKSAGQNQPLVLDEDVGFDNNVQIDRIVDIPVRGQTYYVLIGSNKCGFLCFQREALIYAISSGRLHKCMRAFFDGRDRYDDLEFDYLINAEIKGEPSFSVEINKVTIPVFDSTRTKVIGLRTYDVLVGPDGK